MSKKHLARSVIEGGRSNYYQFESRHSTAVERVHTRQIANRVRFQLDPDGVAFPLRLPVRVDFSDKLGPAKRWLRSQVGRAWNDVRSELFQRFDTRTTAGRHILFCHLLSEVDVEARDRLYCDYHVGANGVLRYEDERPRYPWSPRPRLPEPEVTLRAWLNGRRVIERGTRLYWLVPTLHGGFRQQHELAPADTRRFSQLPAWFREPLLGPITVAHPSGN